MRSSQGAALVVKQPKIAFIGIGNMGGRMARRLVDAGYPVSVFDVDQGAARAFAGVASVAATVSEAVADADFVLTSLPTHAIVADVYLGQEGVLEKAPPGSLAIDLSTIDPDTARRVAAACDSRGIAFLDAPVSRGVQAAEQGTLSIMAGGDFRVLDRARAVLTHLAVSITHCGPVGSGQLAKLCNNMVAAVTMVALGEVFVAGVRGGLSTELLYDVLHASSADSHILSEYFTRVVFPKSRPSNFSLDFMVKDIDLYLAAVSGAASPISEAVRAIFGECQDQDLGPRDATAVVEFYEGPAGVRLEMDKAGQ
jgi:3-hydroxyisobutyrate dehydrogenase